MGTELSGKVLDAIERQPVVNGWVLRHIARLYGTSENIKEMREYAQRLGTFSVTGGPEKDDVKYAYVPGPPASPWAKRVGWGIGALLVVAAAAIGVHNYIYDAPKAGAARRADPLPRRTAVEESCDTRLRPQLDICLRGPRRSWPDCRDVYRSRLADCVSSVAI